MAPGALTLPLTLSLTPAPIPKVRALLMAPGAPFENEALLAYLVAGAVGAG